MNALQRARTYVLVGAVVFASYSAHVLAKTNSDKAKREAQKLGAERDGQHDFDFLVGSWKFHLKRLKQRLVGSTEWVEFDGTTVCRKVLDGRGEVEEMSVDNPEKGIHIQGLALRLYNPQSHQWSIYWVNAADGVLEPNPMVGQFSNGRGEFTTNKFMRARQFMRGSRGQTPIRIRRTLSRRFPLMVERPGKRTG